MKKVIKSVFISIIVLGSLQLQRCFAMDTPDVSTNISKDALTALYQNEENSYLFIPIQELISADGAKVDLKELFARHGFCTFKSLTEKAWDDSDWEYNLSKLINMQKEGTKITGTYLIYHDRKCTLGQLAVLLADAKKLAKSFLGSERDFQGPIIKKVGLNRIFTYAKLQQVITDKKLHHIRLPIKRIFIQDRLTGTYLSKAEASKVIDDALKICVVYGLACKIRFVSDKYKLEVLASKEKSEGKGFSKATQDELFVLCQEAPFDIGDDNIFWDAQGNAIIIDTEYKGVSDDCFKITRYPIDPDL